MKIPLIDLQRQMKQIKQQVLAEIGQLLDQTSFIMGPEVVDFETKFTELIHTDCAVSCNSGTDALVLSLEALGVGSGDEVITTPFTYFATADSISRVGAKPVFVDVDRDTYNLNPDLLEAAITQKTKAILPVHIFGQPADMAKILAVAERHGLAVLEDACQAIGAQYTFPDGRTQPVGSLGNIAAFSFYPTKNLGGYGDGGMVTTSDAKLAQIVKALRTHGGGVNGKKAYELMTGETVELDEAASLTADATIYDPTKYYNFLIGMNSRLDAFQAAVLTVKLKYLAAWNAKRQELAKRYDELIAAAGLSDKLRSQQTSAAAPSVRHLYVVTSEERQALTAFLGKNGVSAGIYYPVPLHLQTVYRQGKFNLGYQPGDLPVSEWLSERTLALPLFPEMTLEEQDFVLTKLKEFYK